MTLSDIHDVDPEISRTLTELQELVIENSKDPSVVTYKGVLVEDLHLNFTLPGYESIELIENGRQVAVTLKNLQEYINLVCKETLLQIPQISAFREGLTSLTQIIYAFRVLSF